MQWLILIPTFIVVVVILEEGLGAKSTFIVLVLSFGYIITDVQ